MVQLYLIGQRVVVGSDFIGTVSTKQKDNTKRGCVWIIRPDGVESCYDEHNVRPLPNGQL